jgi:alpha-L-fucosidase
MSTAWVAPDRLAWWNQAKFGLFIHWGPCAVAGVEASWPIMFPEAVPVLFGPQPTIREADYMALAERFNPTAFDASEWVRLAQAAGMRYLVFTSKHHDGYCLFDAPGTDYKVTAGPFGRNVVAELAQACGQAKLPLGLYYSPPDLHHPGYRDTSKLAVKNWLGQPERPEWGAYLDYMEGHLRKLLTDYGPVAILWFDGLFGQEHYDPERFHRLVHALGPATLVNDRLGPSLGDYVTPEQFVPTGIPVRRPPAGPPSRSARLLGKALAVGLRSAVVRRFVARNMKTALDKGAKLGNIPVALYPAPEAFQPWETCMTLNRTWAYNPHDAAWKSTKEVVHTLVEVASRGGNLLLNVGPDPEGTFPPEAVERLQGVGRWLAVNGEAIYGTTYGAVQGLVALRTTSKGDMLYAHVLNWPANGRVLLPRLERRVQEVRSLATGRVLPFEDRGEIIAISGPKKPPDALASVLALRLDKD